MKMRISALFALVLAALILLTGFNPRTDMPFNGDIRFHDICLTIPESFIRDSTRSDENLWVFEKGFYKQYIVITRNENPESPLALMQEYMHYLRSMGAKSRPIPFLNTRALLNTQTDANRNWQELYFLWEDDLYAVALNGGSPEDFTALTDSIRIAEAQP